MSPIPEDPRRRRELVEEFRRRPCGRHSPDLRLMLNHLRYRQKGDPYILVCTKPQAEWTLARKPPGRGSAVSLVPGFVFTSPDEAEWAVFKLLWKDSTGESLT